MCLYYRSETMEKLARIRCVADHAESTDENPELVDASEELVTGSEVNERRVRGGRS